MVSDSDGARVFLLFVVVPLSFASVFGFTLGAQIVDRRPTGYGLLRATFLGIVVAVLSYIGMASVHMVSALLARRFGGTGEGLNEVLGVYLVGVLFMGWLIAGSGGLAGLLLAAVSETDAFNQLIEDPPPISSAKTPNTQPSLRISQ